MKMRRDQAQRIKTYAHDVWVKFGLYPALVEDTIYEYILGSIPKRMRRQMEEGINADKLEPYFDQMDVYITKAENRFGKEIQKYLHLKALEVKPEGLLSPEEFQMLMQRYYANAVRDGEEERAHILADELMTDVLSALGYKKGCDLFNDMPKWYA